MTTINRLLDEAFAGVESTPEVLDLKDEVRANLEARVAELEAGGMSSNDAAQRAMRELGDVNELIAELPATSITTPVSGLSNSGSAAWAMNRVRPKPGFVVRVTIASLVATGSLLTVFLAIVSVIPLPLGATIALLGLGSSAVGWIVGDSLHQETSTNHPMPGRRAGGYYLATALTIFGLGFTALVVVGNSPVWTIVFAAIALAGGIVLFAFLGATQTNRHKAWALRHSEQYQNVGNRFDEDPESAARFGIYTAVILTVAVVVFLVLSFTIGWTWSWLALVGGFLVMMIVLAQMLFPAKK